MSVNSGAKLKGWIKNNDNGKIMPFQFNPTTLDYSRGASYSESSAPGMPYPITQFIKGESRSFTIPLFLYDDPYKGVIDEYIKFFEEALPPEVNSVSYTRPPELTICYGYFIKKCVLENLSISILTFDSNQKPVMADISLQLKQVGV